MVNNVDWSLEQGMGTFFSLPFFGQNCINLTQGLMRINFLSIKIYILFKSKKGGPKEILLKADKTKHAGNKFKEFFALVSLNYTDGDKLLLNLIILKRRMQKKN